MILTYKWRRGDVKTWVGPNWLNQGSNQQHLDGYDFTDWEVEHSMCMKTTTKD